MFVRKLAIGFLVYCAAVPLPEGATAAYQSQKVTPRVSIVSGPINGVLVRQAGKTLAVYGDPRPDPPLVEKVLFTHHRRDVVRAGRGLVERGAEAIVPEAERELFTGVTEFWGQFAVKTRFHDYRNQTTKILAEPFRRVRTVHGGDRIDWEGTSIEVLDTPGYTRGSVSYLLELDGKRIACAGDLIYGDGKILDLYSLQDEIAETREDGYHGYAARAADVITSLRKIAEWKPDLLIPARGPAIDHPTEAIDILIKRLRAALASHFEIDALRWYRGDDKLRIQAGRVMGGPTPQWMPSAETVQKDLPIWIVQLPTSRLIISGSGAAFLVDCGNQKVVQEVRRLQQEGLFKTLDGIFITHYHDDHTNFAQAAASEFHCPVLTSAEMKDILAHPGAYHMPCLTSNPVTDLQVFAEGERRRWHEFEFTYSYFPGQTFYHDGLVVKKDGGETIFFAGDSFTPTGIDDYCLLNRNLMDPDKGFLYCLSLMKPWTPDYLIINQHVSPLFRFSPQQVDFMIANLKQRTRLLRDVVPWDDANFGVDEQWARFYPYGIEASAGQRLELKVVICNHSPSRQTFQITPHAPAGWKLPGTPLRCSVGPRQEGSVSVPVVLPNDARATGIITADIAFDKWVLWDWTEAVVTGAGP